MYKEWYKAFTDQEKILVLFHQSPSAMKKLLLFIALAALGKTALANNGSSGKDKAIEPIVSGTVVNASTKKPLADVTITATNTVSKTELIVTTDCNGQYKLSQLPAGTYKFKFEKESFRSVEKNNIAIKLESPMKMNIEIVNYKDEDSDDHRNWPLKFDF